MNIDEALTKIYDYFNESNECRNFFYAKENEELYSGYYTSMNLIQDTYNGLLTHRTQGFSSNPCLAYIEFWGVMQAVFIQQDSIAELYRVITDSNIKTRQLTKWNEIRELRNACAGHPAKKNRPKESPLARTFMGRNFGNYDSVTYEKWQSPDLITHPKVPIGNLISEYQIEAIDVLKLVHQHMKARWDT